MKQETFKLITKEERFVLVLFFLILITVYLYEYMPFFELSIELLLGILVSSIFYFIIVYIPEQKRKKIIRDNLKKQYNSFKLNMIRVLVNASGSRINSSDRTELCNLQKFYAFFKGENGDSEKWYAVANKLEEDDYVLKSILIEMEIFMRDISFALNNANIDDDEVFNFFKRFSESVYRLKSLNREYDGVKELMQFLWEVFTGWSWVEGYRRDDIIEKIISRI